MLKKTIIIALMLSASNMIATAFYQAKTDQRIIVLEKAIVSVTDALRSNENSGLVFDKGNSQNASALISNNIAELEVMRSEIEALKRHLEELGDQNHNLSRENIHRPTFSETQKDKNPLARYFESQSESVGISQEAVAIENDIVDHFMQRASGNVSLNDIECRGNSCKVILATPDRSSNGQALDAVLNTIKVDHEFEFKETENGMDIYFRVSQ